MKLSTIVKDESNGEYHIGFRDKVSAYISAQSFLILILINYDEHKGVSCQYFYIIIIAIASRVSMIIKD